ncbi:LCM-domain-containing protein [Piedraia hortae CBS 480.64]|uniref:tRNA wybutosine-synthesizing protein 4 n=1 Tax=Piedraia hortae CBS 480.64 TaxID=1314780 RepID=A0A6A7C467_9PEZI|nr:LCM-domain-containing protein [Piedraia hortae CBS 480.64]
MLGVEEDDGMPQDAGESKEFTPSGDHQIKGHVEEPKSLRTQDDSQSLKDGRKPNKSRDHLIMGTNSSSIVSKRSVEKFYYAGEPEYLRYFVSTFKRRSPLINRGYWLRMMAIEQTIGRFLAEPSPKQKVLVNLGCGYDTLPWLCLGRRPELCGQATFVDVDYPALMQKKLAIIEKTEPLRCLLPNFSRTANPNGLLAHSDPYVAIGCDLYDLDLLDSILHEHLHIREGNATVMFVAEVSLAYMEKEASQQIIEWAANLPDSRFCLLEQHLPDGADHPFARTMLAHFEKLGTPLKAIGTMEEMRRRFIDAGWPERGVQIQSLWKLWSDPAYLTPEQRRSLDDVEPFDEWEEFALFGSHYFHLVAELTPPPRPPKDLKEQTSHLSLASHPSSSTPSKPAEQPLQAPMLPGKAVFRRYAAVVPATSEISEGEAVGLLGGLGTQERLTDCDTYARTEDLLPIQGPPMRTGLVCHTITRLGGTSNCIMAGGRTSPDKASAECWLRQDGLWRKVQSLPEGRYRHCAAPLRLPTDPRPAHTVLLFGGKTSNGHVLDEWLLWLGEEGWRHIPVVGDAPPARFGAAMITNAREGVSGVLIGGMTSSGRVLNDFWHWSLEPDLTLYCRNVTARALAVLRNNAGILGRFGAQLVRTNRGILMIGGICDGRMLTSQDEVLNMKTLRIHPMIGPRPLFIGTAITDVDGGLIVLGGGATCFSFGSHWNKPAILTDDPEASLRCGWQLLTTQAPATAAESPIHHPVVNGSGPRLPEPSQLPRRSLEAGIDFERICEDAKPVVFCDGDIGRCTRLWDVAYLKRMIGADRKVVVHSSSGERMDFAKKNFEYRTMEFGAFLDRCERGERLYLRSISQELPSEQPTNLADDYPEIAADFELPGELISVVESLHSSPLRISGPVRMWLHYDVMANVLCQVRGRKRVRLYPPADVNLLGFAPGASSSLIDVFEVGEGGRLRAALANTHPFEVDLHPGEILFIPPMWMHTVAPTDGISVAVNIFFRNLGPEFYAAGKDVYGNRDLAAYERGRRDVAKMTKWFEALPPDIARFYLERLGQELIAKGRTLASSSLHSLYAELS